MHIPASNSPSPARDMLATEHADTGSAAVPFIGISEFYDTLSVLLATRQAFDRHIVIAAIELNRFDGLVASLTQEGLADLLAEAGRRIQAVAGPNAPIANMRRGVIVTCLAIDTAPGTIISDAVLPDAFLPDALLKMFQEPIAVGDQLVFLPVNVGIARYPDHGTDGDVLVHAAWLAAHVGRQTGEGRCHVYHPSIGERLKRKYFVEHALRQALSKIGIASPREWGEALRETMPAPNGTSPFHLVYQPKVDLETIEVLGVEALIRWDDPAIGARPDEFIAIAEETGLIVPLGRWIVRQALRDHQAWRAGGLNVKLAINVSPAQLSSAAEPRFPEFLAHEIEAAGVEPAKIEIEITEGIMADPQARAAIDELSASGVHIAVDDFGKFYSNLAILSSIPASTLKIDKEFVDDIVTDDKKRIIAQQVVTLARSLGMRSIMEGVETSEQLEILSTLGCDEVQGYVFSRPLAANLVPLAQANIATLISGFGGRSSFRKPTSLPDLVQVLSDRSETDGPTPSRAPAAQARSERKKRIILIDDQAYLCEAVAIGLERRGYEVDQFLDPLRALAALAQDPQAWDLVITDENMPHMRGLQLLTAVKQLRHDLPVILWTGYAGEVPEDIARAHGADAYLQKPAGNDQLAQEVLALLSPQQVSNPMPGETAQP